MSITQRSMLALFAALLLEMAAGTARPAAAQVPSHARGIWVHTQATGAWTLTVINLTNHPLSLVTNSTTPGPSGGSTSDVPFHGDTTCNANTTVLCVPIAPYRNVTWKSNAADASEWMGALTFLPQGMDPKWTVTLNFSPAQYGDVTRARLMDGTWAYITANYPGNPDWGDYVPYNISCSYPDSYNTWYNVMTLSGTDLAVTLYAPYIVSTNAPTVDVTLVFRQRWPHTQLTNGYQDSLLMPCLNYQDNSISYPPYYWY